jgi:hypothetical protein
MMKNRSLKGLDRQRVALLLLGNLVVGIGLPIAISLLAKKSVDNVQSGIVGLLIFTALTAVEALLRVDQLYAVRVGQAELWRQRSAVDSTLIEVRTGLHEIIADESLRDSFFLDYYQRELDLVKSRVRDTIANREILIDRHHIDSTYVLLSMYDKPEHKEFRATTVLQDVGDTFDVTYEVYFHEWLKRLNAGKVTTLRRLFILDKPEELNRENVRKLLAFHIGKVPGLQSKLVNKNEFLRFKSDYHIQDNVMDVGIFSNEYVYLGQTRRGENISGHFSRDPVLIRTYASVFDAVWSSAWAHPLTQYITRSITADELFNPAFHLDEVEPAAPAVRPLHGVAP